MRPPGAPGRPPGRPGLSGRVAIILITIILIATASVTWLSSRGSTPSPLSDPQLPFAALHSTRTQAFVDPAGKPVILKAINLQPVWSKPPTTWPASTYRSIADEGFNSVRMVVFWNAMQPSSGSFDQQAFAALDKAVQRASDAGLRIILDPIHLYGDNGLGTVPDWAKVGDAIHSVSANGGQYLRYIAQRYKQVPAIAGYDLVNEPTSYPLDQNSVLRMYDGLIPQVRAVEPDKILLIEPAYGNSLIEPRFADFSILSNWHNLVWSIHDYYAGGSGDGYDPQSGLAAGAYTWRDNVGYAQPNPAELASHLSAQLTRLREIGLPLWIGEFGIDPKAVNRDQWIKDKVALYTKYGLGFAYWEYYEPNHLSATTPDHAWYPWIRLVTGK